MKLVSEPGGGKEFKKKLKQGIVDEELQFKMTKMKHAGFPVTLRFVLTHSSDRFNFKSA